MGLRGSPSAGGKVTKAGFSLADTKNGKPRIVPIHPRIAVLARRVKFTIDGDRFSGQWEKARKAAGLPHVRFHDLRHGAASEMINRGVDLYTVGGVLGHKSVVSTKRYSHLLTDRLADAIGKIGGKR
ncbi:site-specific integrase [Cupriavidus gilardii]|uniref:site-specific integrase n=1 Tax=Cupriavidus gilardii TaxID=82541 RepID=UPI00158091BE|nr:site-specific integrase [Cupriavidus gilardii]MCT9070924.1 site-specific integrase [Cupriavidus gilardii]QKS62947.1 site-specific integrase [Cupriavidus gilardii]